MLLIGFLLLSTVLAAAQGLGDDIKMKVFIENGQVKSLELQQANEALELGWKTLRGDRHRQKKGYGQEVPIVLNLDNSDITGFEEGWYHLNMTSRNASLYLDNNKIEYLRNGTIDIKKLVLLYLSDNSIRKIESGALNESQLLTELNLHGNQLTDTKFVATLPRNLETLYLSNNAITEISADSFSALSRLQTLDLHGNKITTIQKQAFHGLTDIYRLDLSYNPIEKVEIGSFDSNRLLGRIHMARQTVDSSTDVNNLLTPKNNSTFLVVSGYSIG